MRQGIWRLGAVLVLVALSVGAQAATAVDDTPGKPGEWGFHPEEGSTSRTTPPGFVWRRQEKATSYTLQIGRDATFEPVEYEAAKISYNCHCPSKVLAPGRWFWRFRFVDDAGKASAWSKPREFTIGPDAVAYPMPPRGELLGRIPKAHPRMFLRPEDLPALRERAKSDLKPACDQLIRQCNQLMKKPPPTAEPPKYPSGMVQKSEEWRKIWWGNREYTITLLDGAATLAFTRLLSGNEAYGQMARRLLMAAAEWAPKGATGYLYNDEAGMPYASRFSRTYTFVNDLLSEEERAKCRQVMRVRGQEMYKHLCPRHIWMPYASHSNRAWHFLGEVGVAFLDEIPEASEWVWFAMNVFFNVYPVWCDDDGGWHEGVSYWKSYIERFTWWADIMRSEMGISAYQKPYFSQVGYYPMYFQPPGTVGGGFGDQTERTPSAMHCRLMTNLAIQAHNGYWQWYVEANGGPSGEGGYIGFMRGVLPKVEAKVPTDLPSSRCFRGIGQAVLNTTLLDARKNVAVFFKSSPFGQQSHGFEANNSFALYAFGERLLVRSGERDIHGSEHHYKWMHHTKSGNNITINGQGQLMHSAASKGRITGFFTSEAFDYVCGEAGGCYGETARRYTRHILFIKPELIVVYDRLETPQPATFNYWLHSFQEMAVRDPRDIEVRDNVARCRVSFLQPSGLQISQTNRFDPPPRDRVKLTQWHLTASTTQAATHCEFVTLLRPYRAGQNPATEAKIETTAYGHLVKAALASGEVLIGLRAKDGVRVQSEGLSGEGDVVAVVTGSDGKRRASFP